MKGARAALALPVALLLAFLACSVSPTPTPTPSPPHLTSEQARGIVGASLAGLVAAYPTTTVSIGKPVFNYANRQWFVSVGVMRRGYPNLTLDAVYVVDDATAKLLNPPIPILGGQ